MANRIRDLTGQVFGRLTVIRQDGRTPSGQVIWLCRCDCGNEKSVPSTYLVSKQTSSCGCLAKETTTKRCLDDLTGQVFGRLTVISKDDKNSPSGNSRWKCQCECGNMKTILSFHLKQGKTRSCGCYRRELRVNDLRSMRFGRLTVIDEDCRSDRDSVYWMCRCDCGQFTSVAAGNLHSGDITSCGCYRRETLINDISGQRFGKLTALSLIDTKGGHAHWSCRCDCGKIITARGGSLTSGQRVSCGCYGKYKHDWNSQRFRSRWEVWLSMWYDVNGIGWGYETTKLHLNFRGRDITYRPDFTLDNGTMVEVKGRLRYAGFESLAIPNFAVSMGYDLMIIQQPELEARLGLKLSRLQYIYAKSGLPGCYDAILTATSR